MKKSSASKNVFLTAISLGRLRWRKVRRGPLCSGGPCFGHTRARRHNRPPAAEPLGNFVFRREPHLGFGPDQQYNHPLCGDGRHGHNRHKIGYQATGFVGIPPTAGPQGPTGQVNNRNTSSFLVGNGGNNGRLTSSSPI